MKLILIVGVLFLSLLTASTISLIFAHKRVSAIVNQSESTLALIDGINDIKLVFNQEIRLWKSLLIQYNNQDQRRSLEEKFNTTIERILVQIGKLIKNIPTEEQNLLAEFTKKQNQIKLIAKSMLASSISSSSFNLEAADKSTDELNAQSLSLLNKLSDNISDFSEKNQENAVLDIRKVFILGLLFIILIGIVTMGVSIAIVNQISHALSQVSESLKLQSSGVKDSAGMIRDQSKSILQGSLQQASAVEETSASVTQIQAMSEKSAENSENSRERAEKNKLELEVGSKSIERMITSMDEIRKSNEGIINQVIKNYQDSDEIIKIFSEIEMKTQIINDIVFQTKLLSFNASVEAARAGENGKGFAVVAEEVGNLAKMSGAAATDINQMLHQSISTIKDMTHTSRSHIEKLVADSRNILEEGIKDAESCNLTFTKLAEFSENLVENLTSISNSAKEQSIGIAEVTKAVNLISSSAQGNAGSTRETTSSVESLDAKSAELSSLVTHLEILVKGSY